MRNLPEFEQFKRDMEAAGEAVAIYEDGTPFVHTFSPYRLSGRTTVRVEWFAERFDSGATKCLYPVVEGQDGLVLQNHHGD